MKISLKAMQTLLQSSANAIQAVAYAIVRKQLSEGEGANEDKVQLEHTDNEKATAQVRVDLPHCLSLTGPA